MATKKENNNKKKNLKSEKSKIDSVGSNFDGNILHYVYVISGVLIFICAFYFLTVYITSKNSDDSSKSDEADASEVSISYDNIMVGRSFSISDGEYYVIYYDKNDEDISSDISDSISNYKSLDEHLDIYVVDMSNGLNKSYVKDESNHNPSDASEIAINGPTLIKFNNDQVVEYIEGVDDIKNHLQ